MKTEIQAEMNVLLQKIPFHHGVDKSDLIKIAQERKATPDFLRLLRKVHDHTYTNLAEIEREITQISRSIKK